MLLKQLLLPRLDLPHQISRLLKSSISPIQQPVIPSKLLIHLLIIRIMFCLLRIVPEQGNDILDAELPNRLTTFNRGFS